MRWAQALLDVDAAIAKQYLEVVEIGVPRQKRATVGFTRKPGKDLGEDWIREQFVCRRRVRELQHCSLGYRS